MVRRFSHKELTRILHYDPSTGHFTWRIAAANIVKVGKRAGHHHKTHKYVVITYKKRRYYAHVLAWFYMKKCWPKVEVDHKNLDRGDNRWKNLREACHVDNCANGPLRKNNTTGYRGVARTCYGAYRAAIQREGVFYYLGVFPSRRDAAAAYDVAAQKFNGSFASTNFGVPA